MAVVLLASCAGSPGVTTTALGMALTWPRHVLLADCDRDAAQAVQAGYLRGMDHGGRGLMAVARLHREGVALAPELWRQTLPLIQGGSVQRRLLPGFTSAGSSRLFEHVWAALADAFGMLDAQGVDVIVDAGRVSVHGLPPALLAASDAVLLCVRSSLRSLAAARIHLLTLEDQLGALTVPRPAALAIVGPGRPYSSADIAAQFGLPSWLEPAWDPQAAEVLSDGGDEPKRFSSGRFMGRLRRESAALFERVQRMSMVSAEAAR
ncbi:hypothetical protein BW730_13080 [Tessaracoccus aquimaris]|uniref:CobQ/CobB/MinD/ParA nucleotide binding domain-containing protein n=1 Tax=Tessaracoccus aquimaris TaxID=1332264 RepID=A0A1Q2CQ96_9ACTN|nr:hypothetical protein [Tessaracoccus aquimaris]AQP48298.1 hypothetical protein BW730_13080 [Tessaracoccus aquimaris]